MFSVWNSGLDNHHTEFHAELCPKLTVDEINEVKQVK
jgi:hypothetical protein